jgi:hypothetical protein
MESEREESSIISAHKSWPLKAGWLTRELEGVDVPPVELLKPNYYTIHVPGAEIRPEKRFIFLVHTPKEQKEILLSRL